MLGFSITRKQLMRIHMHITQVIFEDFWEEVLLFRNRAHTMYSKMHDRDMGRILNSNVFIV